MRLSNRSAAPEGFLLQQLSRIAHLRSARVVFALPVASSSNDSIRVIVLNRLPMACGLPMLGLEHAR
jgi:hypothetical protein